MNRVFGARYLTIMLILRLSSAVLVETLVGRVSFCSFKKHGMVLVQKTPKRLVSSFVVVTQRKYTARAKKTQTGLQDEPASAEHKQQAACPKYHWEYRCLLSNLCRMCLCVGFSLKHQYLFAWWGKYSVILKISTTFDHVRIFGLVICSGVDGGSDKNSAENLLRDAVWRATDAVVEAVENAPSFEVQYTAQ